MRQSSVSNPFRSTWLAGLGLMTLAACGAGAASKAGNAATPAPPPASQEAPTTMQPAPDGIYSLEVAALDGQTADLSAFAGKVSLVVNVASECGYTPQYAGLQKLHDEFAARGFQVLGFPCNDFGGQEPGSADQIRSFCTDRFGVTFPMFSKVKVKGDDRSPIYQRLVEMAGDAPSWNFCKYLVGKNGKVLGFWKSGTAPDDAALRAAIEKAL